MRGCSRPPNRLRPSEQTNFLLRLLASMIGRLHYSRLPRTPQLCPEGRTLLVSGLDCCILLCTCLVLTRLPHEGLGGMPPPGDVEDGRVVHTLTDVALFERVGAEVHNRRVVGSENATASSTLAAVVSAPR